jgi:hypothetical protein
MGAGVPRAPATCFIQAEDSVSVKVTAHLGIQNLNTEHPSHLT